MSFADPTPLALFQRESPSPCRGGMIATFIAQTKKAAPKSGLFHS
jgi:hypothetical protein